MVTNVQLPDTTYTKCEDIYGKDIIQATLDYQMLWKLLENNYSDNFLDVRIKYVYLIKPYFGKGILLTENKTTGEVKLFRLIYNSSLDIVKVGTARKEDKHFLVGIVQGELDKEITSLLLFS